MEYKISKQTMQFFKESGLTKEHAEKMHIKDVDFSNLKKLFKNLKFNEDEITAHEIPYFDVSGKVIEYSRYRLHAKDDNIPNYLQMKGQKSRFYFSPFMDWKKIAADPSIPIYITEGERKAAKACVEGFACIGLGGVWNWSRKEGEHDEKTSQPISDFQLIDWRERKVCIVFDSDSHFNTHIQHAIRALRNALVNFGADPYRIDLPHIAGNRKVGLDDFLKLPRGRQRFSKLPEEPLLLNKTITGDALYTQKYEAKKWLVEGLIPYGLGILAGPPKIGKSWLVLECILALSLGKKLFDHYETEEIKCLYLALEDSPRRLKERLQMLSSNINANSIFAFEWERVDDGGLQVLERKLDSEPDIKAVFIDTFAKMRRIPRGRENLYHQDYEAVASLKRLADSRGIAVVVVHHTKKGASDDFLESVSGSMGITGAADTVLVLTRSRSDDEGLLNITGRDVGEQALALKFKEGLWTYKGQASEVFATETQQEVLEIMRAEGRPLRQRTLAELAGRKNGGFKKTLDRMVANGLITRDQNLFYHLADTPPEKQLKYERIIDKPPEE